MDLETIGDSMTPLVVFLIVMVQAGSGAVTSRADPELSSVPLPAGVIISAYNLNPVLCWEYQNMTQEPVFTVQVKNYRDGEWHDACTNVSDHCCSIFNQVDDPADPLWARVKATVGQRESAYVQSKEFILCKQGEIGPPTLNVRRKEDEIIADIFHPLVEINEEVEGIMYEAMYEGSCHTFDYNVYLRVNGSKSLIPKHVHADNCNETQCQLSIPVSSLDSEYCISVQGVSGEWAVATERTKEVCITISSSSVRDSIWIPVVTVLIPFLVIIPLLVYYLMKNPFRKNIMLPKSLISVVRNVTSETKPESKYTSLITSCQPLVPENETVICGEEQASSATVPGLYTQDNLGTAGNTEELAGEIKVLTPEENISDLVTCGPLTPLNKENSTPSDSNQSEPFSFTLNSSHSRNAYDSGLMGSDSLVSDSEFLPNNKAEVKSEGQEPITLRNAPTSFGYDKPHVLVDVIVDEGKESLIGYRPTTGSDEFS